MRGQDCRTHLAHDRARRARSATRADNKRARNLVRALMDAAAAPGGPRPRFGDRFIFRRVLHEGTAVVDLRRLVTNEWATLSVVSGLFLLLAGASSTNAPLPIAAEIAGAAAIRWAFVIATTLAFIGAATSCFASLFLLHMSNTVPAHKLHAFLVRAHSLLWLPLGGLIFAALCTSIGNWCATLLIYGDYGLFAVRVGIALAWFFGLAFGVFWLSHAAQHAAGPRAAPGPPGAGLDGDV